MIGTGAAVYFFVLLSHPALAADMWTTAEDIMKDVYAKILGISTIAAIVTASVALLLMNFPNPERPLTNPGRGLNELQSLGVS